MRQQRNPAHHERDYPHLPGLSPVENKELHARFDGGRLSSDGGVPVLREIEKRLGLVALIAGCLTGRRDQANTIHSHADMIGARLFAIACGHEACGHEDCDDLDILRLDPAFRLACGRLPESGRDPKLGEDHEVTELWQVITGQASGCRGDKQITFFDSVGFAIEDFSALRYIHNAIQGTAFYTRLDMLADPDDPRDLFGMLNLSKA